jgi:UDP-glucuronate 4-epimerase
MKILITGVAGFIGYSFANFLLKKKYFVVGLDNIDNYYSTKLKNKRLKILKKNKLFKFYRIDIRSKKKVKSFFQKNDFEHIFHFAAQAGVRYSAINPKKYKAVNINGFKNIINEIKNKKKLINFFYASSSSIYGSSRNLPVKENYLPKPESLYAKTKVNNEKYALKLLKNKKFNTIGLRFFTVFGEWGRPDMLLFKIFNAFKRKEVLLLNNYGEHMRDFTYIEDVNKILYKLMKKKYFKSNLFNICSNRPIKISKILLIFKKKFKNLKIKKIKKNKLDVLNTHGDNTLVKNFVKFKKFTPFEKAFLKTANWFFKNKIYLFIK